MSTNIKASYENTFNFCSLLSKKKGVGFIMEIFDSVKNHIDVGISEELVIHHFKNFYFCLKNKNLLSEQGEKEYIKPIDDSTVLSDELVIDEAVTFLKSEYNKYTELAKEYGIYGKDDEIKLFDKIYNDYLSMMKYTNSSGITKSMSNNSNGTANSNDFSDESQKPSQENIDEYYSYAAINDMINWLEFPTELGQKPCEIKITNQFEYGNGLYCYVLKYKKDPDSNWMLGIVSDSGVFSEMRDYNESTEIQDAKAILNFLCGYWDNRANPVRKKDFGKYWYILLIIILICVFLYGFSQRQTDKSENFTEPPKLNLQTTNYDITNVVNQNVTVDENFTRNIFNIK